MKNITRIIVVVFLVVAGVYLLVPSPAELAPLPQSLKSIEPGDTYQIPGISAYYTNLSRHEVMDFYQKSFSRSRLLKIPLLTYRLNRPPEDAKTIIRSTQQSSYLEEMIHPLRESLFVNGFEWANDPFTKQESRAKNKMVIDGVEFKSKVTIITQESNPLVRILVLLGFVAASFWLLKEAKGIYGSFRGNSKL